MNHLPIQNAADRISQHFGENPWRYDEICHHGQCLKGHNGIDFTGEQGEEIYAVESGFVTRVAHHPNGFGLHIKIKNSHQRNEWTYAHLEQEFVYEGKTVEAGEVIGLMGNTGWSTGTHLHLGKRKLNQGGGIKNWYNGYLGAVDFEKDLLRLTKKA